MFKLTNYAWAMALCAGMVACSGGVVTQADYQVIPLPQAVNLQGGQPFVLKPSVRVYYPADDAQMAQNASFLSDYVKELTGYGLQTVAGEGTGITLSIDASISNPEGYRLQVDAKGVQIAGATPAGVFYGIQTLRKSIPADAQGTSVELPAVTIEDAPRFSYRGMMLDVGRHYITPDSVKQYIDMIALHNMNRFHWHLSEDQGWRIEIKQYPELTEIGSKRRETVIGHNSGEYDGKEYGGFDTQEQVKEIIDYAAKRYITIIPEIDMPGHQQAALATYPELGCTGGPYEVRREWGISDDVICAGNEKSMQFLENVLGEIIELFPSEYIHVGGDECPKIRWKSCPKCQAKIKELGIKGDAKHSAEEYLQSYVIGRMEKFLEDHGRHLIGWDEILEGGLAPRATVMSWRGMAGGEEAAKQHHNVIMTPNTYVYFDYYQSTDTDQEPQAIGGYLPLEKVYSFEPVPSSLSADERKYIIGAQANLWTEYIPTFKQVSYMVLPRMDALAEVQWTAPEKKNYQQFLPRVVRMTEMYDKLGYHYAKHIFDVNAQLEPDTEQGALKISLTKFGAGDIYYTTDGSNPTASSSKYEAPVMIREAADFKAAVIRPNGTTSRIFEEQVAFNKATMKPITLKEEPSRGYQFNGAPALADGLKGNDNYKTGRWLGFQGKDVDAVIDLKEPTDFSKVSFTTNVVKGDWIMGATGVTVKVSEDGKNFKEVANQTIPELKAEDKDGLYPHEVTFDAQKARYVEVIIHGGMLPKWHGGAGSPAFLFVDEIGIE